MSLKWMEFSPEERRERVAILAASGRSNRYIATVLGVDEATARRDRKFLATPLEQRPVKKPKRVKPVRLLSADQRLKQMHKVVRIWFVEEHLVLAEIEYVLHEAGRRLHQCRAAVEQLPDRSETPSQLLTLARPQDVPEDNMAVRLEYCAEWLCRWLAKCLPREEALQDDMLRSSSKWAQDVASFRILP